jgi:glucan-binding YG repeat protein
LREIPLVEILMGLCTTSQAQAAEETMTDGQKRRFARNKKIYEQYAAGWSAPQLGVIHGLTRARILQIVAKIYVERNPWLIPRGQWRWKRLRSIRKS